MKILFLADIHGIYENLPMLEKTIEKEKPNKICVLGDLYYPGPTYSNDKKIESSKVKDFLMKYKDIMIAVKGNCDSSVDIKATDFPICDNLFLTQFGKKSPTS